MEGVNKGKVTNSARQVKKTPKHQKSAPKMDRFSFINDENLKLAIPIGPRFQADVPEWRGPPHKKYPHSALNESDSLKYIGTVIWPMKDKTLVIEECDDVNVIGKGRPDSCNCSSPGSVLCVKRHINKKTAHLQKSLGPAFYKWRFDQMGDGVAKLWKQPEQQRLTILIRKNLLSDGEGFIEPALECFPLKSKKDIVSFYFNVYIPRRMSAQTRSGCTVIDTDNEEEEKTKIPCSKGSRKRARVNGVTLYNPNLVKNMYMSGRR